MSTPTECINPTTKDVMAWRVRAGLSEWPTQAEYDVASGQTSYDQGYSAGLAAGRNGEELPPPVPEDSQTDYDAGYLAGLATGRAEE